MIIHNRERNDTSSTTHQFLKSCERIWQGECAAEYSTRHGYRRGFCLIQHNTQNLDTTMVCLINTKGLRWIPTKQRSPKRALLSSVGPIHRHEGLSNVKQMNFCVCFFKLRAPFSWASLHQQLHCATCTSPRNLGVIAPAQWRRAVSSRLFSTILSN